MSATTPETQQPQQPQPQGALSGALSSLVAVGQYASRACAAARYDFATLFAHGASPAQRARAAGGLALTAVIVVVLGYAALQEWRIHIAYNPELTRQQLLKATYDAAGAEWQTHKPWHLPSIFEEENERATQAAPRDVPPPTTPAERAAPTPTAPNETHYGAGLLAIIVLYFVFFIFHSALNATKPFIRWSAIAALAFPLVALTAQWLLE